MTTNAATRGWGDPTKDNYASKVVGIDVDNTTYQVHKDVALIFKTFLTRLCEENNYSLDEVQDDWSFIVRPIRGYEAKWESTHDFDYLSNHSWALAVDVNATKNPMGKKLKTDLPVGWIRANVRKYGLLWGGDFSDRKDSMHFEFGGTPKDARAITNRIKMENLVAKLDDDDRAFIDATVKKYALEILGAAPGQPDNNTNRVSNKDLQDAIKALAETLDKG